MYKFSNINIYILYIYVEYLVMCTRTNLYVFIPGMKPQTTARKAKGCSTVPVFVDLLRIPANPRKRFAIPYNRRCLTFEKGSGVKPRRRESHKGFDEGRGFFEGGSLSKLEVSSKDFELCYLC